MAKNPRIGVVLGSMSDRKTLDASQMSQVFDACGIPWRLAVISAHRHDEELSAFCKEMLDCGACALIGVAGMTPALPGAMAAKTKGVIPIIGVPLSTASPDSFMGMYGITGLPPRTVAAAFGYDTPGLINAAIFAVQIVATANQEVKQRLVDYLTAKSAEKKAMFDIPHGTFV